MVKWNIELLTGVSDIDEYHKHLVKLLNDAYEGFLIGINIEEFYVDELLDLMFLCFACEESWMMNTSYPFISTHRAEHELFAARFIEIRKQYTQDAYNSVEILIFLNNYVNHHIREADKKFGSFVDGIRLKTMANKEQFYSP